jgi:hypothetical protein
MLKDAILFRIAGLVLTVIFFAGVSALADQSQVIKPADVPRKVYENFLKNYRDAKVDKIEKEEEKGKVYYEFEIKSGDREKTIIYREDGNLYAVETMISPKSLPRSVVDAIKKAYPDGEIDEADEIVKGKETSYEVVVEIEKDGKETEYEILITADGKILETQQIMRDDDEYGDKDEDGDFEEDGDEED